MATNNTEEVITSGDTMRTPNIDFNDLEVATLHQSSVTSQIASSNEHVASGSGVSSHEANSNLSLIERLNSNDTSNIFEEMEQSTSSNRRRKLYCHECKQEIQRQMYGCLKCHSKFHPNCTGFNTANLKTFVCLPCEKKYKQISEFKYRQPRMGEKSANYYEVNKIIAWRYSKDGMGRDFQIKWKGFIKTTWEPEEHLIGAVDMLQSFCRINEISPSKIDYVFGGNKKSTFNEKNWVTLNQIIEKYVSMLKLLKGENWLVLEKIEKFSNKDGLYLLPAEFHTFVVLYLSEQKLCYIADGDNSYESKANQFAKIRKDLEKQGTSVIPVPYEWQATKDKCGSSAVLIALALARNYANNDVPGDLKITAKTMKKVVSRMHKHDSRKRNGFNFFKFCNTKTKCRFCGKLNPSRKDKVSALRMHERKCQMKNK